jgi:hypothetical protein
MEKEEISTLDRGMIKFSSRLNITYLTSFFYNPALPRLQGLFPAFSIAPLPSAAFLTPHKETTQDQGQKPLYPGETSGRGMQGRGFAGRGMQGRDDMPEETSLIFSYVQMKTTVL